MKISPDRRKIVTVGKIQLIVRKLCSEGLNIRNRRFADQKRGRKQKRANKKGANKKKRFLPVSDPLFPRAPGKMRRSGDEAPHSDIVSGGSPYTVCCLRCVWGCGWRRRSRRQPHGHSQISHQILYRVTPETVYIGVRVSSPERRIFSRVREGEGVRHREKSFCFCF